MLTTEEIKEWEDKINAMSQTEMARLWRFAPLGHPVFDHRYSLCKRFKQRFEGFTAEISKHIGWDG